MAITVDWPNKIINIPRNDLILLQSVPTEIRELDLNELRLRLKDLEDDPEGMPWVDTHRHVQPISVGGVTLARVLEIINGYTVTFEDGQYAVNLKGANTNVQDVTNVNQVSVRPSNSAGLQDLSTVLAASYNGEVVVDVINGQSGTSIPIGTRSTPVDNFADAITLATRLGIHHIAIKTSCTLANADFSSGFTFEGDSPVAVILTVDPSADVSNCTFRNLTIQGAMDGYTVIRECNILSITNFDGFLWQCALNLPITLKAGSQATIADCFSNVAGGGPGQTPEIDMAGNATLAMRGYNGGLTISNFAGGGAVSMDFNSGRLIVASTITGGDIYVRGSCQVTDNSTGTAVVHDQTLHYDLVVINEGVKKASILVPHTQDH